MKKQTPTLKALGRKVTKFTALETFPAPKGLEHVELISDEVTSLCPVTGQPDFMKVTICYYPKDLAVESKTVKMLLGSYRDKGLFCEAFACELAQIFADAVKVGVWCQVEQKARGGVIINAIGSASPEGMPNSHYISNR